MDAPRDARMVVGPPERDWLLEAFARGLDVGEHILQLTDTYRASGRHTLHLPLDEAAEVLLSEPPRVLPGGITEIVSYVRARDRTVRETTFEDDTLHAECLRVVRPVRSWELSTP